MGLYINTAYIAEDGESGERYHLGEDEIEETGFDKPGDLFRALSGRDRLYPWRAMGRCISKVYVDMPDGTARHVGWVFVKRERYEDDPKRTYLREAWVTVHEAPPTVTHTYHYAELAR